MSQCPVDHMLTRHLVLQLDILKGKNKQNYNLWQCQELYLISKKITQ